MAAKVPENDGHDFEESFDEDFWLQVKFHEASEESSPLTFTNFLDKSKQPDIRKKWKTTLSLQDMFRSIIFSLPLP